MDPVMAVDHECIRSFRPFDDVEQPYTQPFCIRVADGRNVKERDVTPEAEGTWAERDRRSLWHPFTWIDDWDRNDPLVIVEGDGMFLVDGSGNRYIDGVSSLWCNVHGHRVPELDEALKGQVGRLAHSTFLGLTHPWGIELAERILERAPDGLTRVFYSDNGATSVEVALKMAFQHCRLIGKRKKRRFISLGNAYHGDTIGSVSIGGMEAFHGTFGPLLFEGFNAPEPNCARCHLGLIRDTCTMECLDRAVRLIEEKAQEVCAFIIEPLVQGAAGIIIHPEGYLAGVARACRDNDVLLVTDEVATGVGRTGSFFACEHEDIHPDILCLGKGITGGYLPLAATLVTEAIYDSFRGGPERTFFHGHTYTANPLACSVSLASLELMDTEFMEAVRRKGELMSEWMAKLSHRRGILDAGNRGLMGRIELAQEDGRSFPSSRRIGAQVCSEVRRHGVILRNLGDVVVLMPPLAISEEELQTIFQATETALGTVLEAEGLWTPRLTGDVDIMSDDRLQK